MNSVYQIITDQILEQLNKGVIPWRKPWIGGDMPKNFISGKAYRGINPFLLSCTGFKSNQWLSFKQAQACGGNVCKGEKSSIVIFWKKLNKARVKIEVDNEGNELSSLKCATYMLRYYRVFNTEQCEGLELPDEETFEHNPIELCEGIIENMPNRPALTNEELRAYYRPSKDTVNMPGLEHFLTPESYYATMFHELGHSTGHSSRLNRKGIDEVSFFGSHSYAREELVAEMCASMLCGVTGISDQVIENSASYIDGWRSKISQDPKLIIQTAAQAQKAADCIQGILYN